MSATFETDGAVLRVHLEAPTPPRLDTEAYATLIVVMGGAIVAKDKVPGTEGTTYLMVVASREDALSGDYSYLDRLHSTPGFEHMPTPQAARAIAASRSRFRSSQTQTI